MNTVDHAVRRTCLARCMPFAAALLLPVLSACEVPAPAPSPGGPYGAPYGAPPPVYAPPPQPVYTTPPPVYYDQQADIRRCEADNRRAHTEVLELYNRASRSGRIDGAEAQRFTALQVRLNNINAQLNRGGLTLQECRSISSVLASDRQEVLRMSRSDATPVPPPVRPGPDPALGRCVAEVRRTHDDTVETYNNGVRTGRISPNEAQRFKAMEQRLNNLRAQSRRDGLTLGECQNILQAVARERAAVDAMIRH